ncbi:hypothetical protein C2869_00525 [Saccharobesus litoralis]|uniref:Uncharacterized protein n=1 Tax=Saccharobesus litoralis TaxID=2172099 RepID=A0A2S0VLE0_9ALTE|nr:hypothetical protein C2869_00525 [Saccharobesus litoralis]
MTNAQLFQLALNNNGHFQSTYNPLTAKALKNLIATRIQTENGEFSLVFLHKIDKKSAKIEFMLSKAAIDNHTWLIEKL